MDEALVMLPGTEAIAALSDGLIALYPVVLLVLLAFILRGVVTTSILGDGPTGDADEPRHCGNCGASVPAEASTCEHCGNPLTDEN